MKKIIFPLLVSIIGSCQTSQSTPVTQLSMNVISVGTMRDIVQFMQSYYKHHEARKGKALLDAIEQEVSLHDAMAVLKVAAFIGLKPLLEFCARLIISSMPSKEELLALIGTLDDGGSDQLERYYFLLTGDDLIEDARISGYSVQDYLDYHPFMIANKTMKYRLDLARLRLNSLDGISNIPRLETFRFLELDHNMLTRIEPHHLKGFAGLILLHMQHNKFVTLDSDTFCALKELKTIRLENNALEHLDSRVFTCLPALRSLILFKNKLSPDAIIALQESLPEVAIDY